MANINAPFGFRPIQSAVGAASNFEMVQAQILYSDSTKIFRGDPVQLKSSGYIGQWAGGATVDVSQLYGIFWGVTYLSASQGKQVQNNYWPGADVAANAQNSIVASIIPCTGSASPLFIVQSDATGTAFADIGQNVDVVLGTGNTLNGQSGAYLDNTSHMTTTNTLPFRIVQLYGGSQGAGGFGGIQPGTNGPYSGSPTGPYNWAVVRANVTGFGATGV